MGKTDYRGTAPIRLYDAAVRLALRLGYRSLKALPRSLRPRGTGVGVVIRCRDRVLAVRHSYRPGYDIPGGGVGRNEHPRDTAVRELAEELSLQIDRDSLIYKRRHHRSHLYEITFPSEPDIRVDNREVVEAVFLTPEEAIARNPDFRHFV